MVREARSLSGEARTAIHLSQAFSDAAYSILPDAQPFANQPHFFVNLLQTFAA
jgi:hypothetical protein